MQAATQTRLQRGNACLSCDKFVSDASHQDELRRQLTDTERLVTQRKAAFLTKYGGQMDEDNVWQLDLFDLLPSPDKQLRGRTGNHAFTRPDEIAWREHVAAHLNRY